MQFRLTWLNHSAHLERHSEQSLEQSRSELLQSKATPQLIATVNLMKSRVGQQEIRSEPRQQEQMHP